MSWQAFTGFLVLAATAALLLLQGRKLGLRLWSRFVRMDQAWRAWMDLEPLDDKERTRRLGLLEHLNEAVRASVHSNLLEFEALLKADKAPLLTLRRELMDSVDRRLLNLEILQLPPEVRQRLRAQSSDMLQTDEEAGTYIAANEVRMAVLREYAARRFGDRADGDWFHVYEKASRLKQRGARNFIQRTLNGTQTGADDARYQNMTRVDQEIRTRLLKVPAGTRFEGLSPGKPATE
ncbi:MAG TPA: hypothetical protein VFV77_09765 [Gammaproteobacteria bacterium]|nr:hypothetical protein [Terriglobales bacterium]HEU5399561.1 hypothetical protein [Gammaproteobacteria bacterium]